jgi:hypothetical protein
MRHLQYDKLVVVGGAILEANYDIRSMTDAENIIPAT